MRKYLALFFVGMAALKAEPEFSGFLTMPGSSSFFLTDTEQHDSSGWLTISQAFHGYTLVSFDRDREVITLKKSDHIVNLSLREAKVKNGRMTINGVITLSPNDRVKNVRASLFLGEESVFPIKDSVKLHLLALRNPDGNILYRSRFTARDIHGIERAVAAPIVLARPGESFSVQSGDFGYAFTP